ncbi:hypothetical protein SSBR45G_46820 [Bradyrhizobium sp. SSBR45G]|uniref:hypothetical protein n=1 Tax=unclassified Bradyrhizobium TaxID=2631580 RepID=UPI0023429D62|nr:MULTISPECIES: hypothetical protein [unclassified Bradyrhizobium]GLH79773.1 hypothetical protein SSBR45G_46820 [Bradyrhizobium sp. SSBR45G]GLH87109.1 hypothetical protein SSBR45R_45690 [Bradyrhizobium sp. SSBR45R]
MSDAIPIQLIHNDVLVGRFESALVHGTLDDFEPVRVELSRRMQDALNIKEEASRLLAQANADIAELGAASDKAESLGAMVKMAKDDYQIDFDDIIHHAISTLGMVSTSDGCRAILRRHIEIVLECNASPDAFCSIPSYATGETA